jgi:hypothetical protein
MGRKPKIEQNSSSLSELSNEDILIDGNFYKGNENLLRGKAQIKWTPEMIEEIKLCAKKVLHFAEEYFYIITEDGKEKITLYKYQKQLLKAFVNNRFNVVLSSRQSGKTTTITIYALWMVCFQEDKRITIVANKEDTAKEIFSRIKMSFEELPIWMKPAVKSFRKDGFELENGSRITISSTSSAGPRGSTSNLLIIDEMAHCPNDLMKELWKSAIPIISSMKRSQLVVISTPNGVDNKFYELVEQAKKPDSDWHLETVNWWDVPGRDERWKKEAMDAIGSKEDFDQEYGNVFHEKGKSAIDPEELERLKTQCKDPILVMDNGDYKIFTQPKEDSFYVIGVDVGEGIGRSNTVAQILDVSDLTKIEQVAVYASNTINPYNFGTRLMGVLEDWGRPPILIENNNNGQQVLDVLARTHNYENIVTYTFEGMSKHYNNENRLGVHNHTNTRYKGITNFRYWANSLRALKLNDLDTALELATFVRLPNFTFSKRSDKDLDDRVLALVWGLFLLDPSLATKYFNVTELDDQGRPLKIKPLIDNTDLIKKSPIFEGKISIYKKTAITSVPMAWVGKFDPQNNPQMDDEIASMNSWLMNWDKFEDLPVEDLHVIKPLKPETNNNDKYEGEGYMPSILF